MPEPLSVSELTREIKNLLEGHLPYIQVEGEISNYKSHYSGHAYFVLKDDSAQLSAVMWRTSAERSGFNFEDGKQVTCSGRVTLYEKSGRYQLVVDRVESIGKGDLHQQFEALKQKLDAAGYFSATQKKPIPKFPKRIGIVTSPTGAAIQDMLSVAMRRNPSVELILRECKVQGLGAGADVASAIDEFNQFADVDLLIIGRGGGSLEDLWAFNEEVVAEAIYRSTIPIVSAVGHEIDFSISDFVADLRAPTPSAAMELVIADKNELLGHLAYIDERVYTLILNKLRSARDRVQQIKSHYALKSPELILKEKRSDFLQLRMKLDERVTELLKFKHDLLLSKQGLLRALSPESVLGRGFVILKQNGEFIDKAAKLKDKRTEIIFKDGQVIASLKRED
jgi:exodeoxyribonuclease VII large subunit